MAVADALVSKVVDMLVSSTDREFTLVSYLQVQSLTYNLQSIQAVLIDAERRQQKEESVRIWVNSLKRLVYEIDNVLDEWSYEILKSQSVTWKVWSFGLLYACFCFPKLALRQYRIACKINYLYDRLDVIASEKDKYGFLLLRDNYEQMTTTSVINISEDKDTFRAGLLSKEESWSLFCEVAFSWRSSEDRQNLETIGIEIVARCKGSPLAIKLIGGLLCFKKSRQEWENVLDSELWKLDEVQQDILGPLWLSYYDLPSSLKQCFLYCVVFPKGYRMSKDELISLWMAHGFLKPTEDRDMEMIGHDYFHNLCIRSLFQEFEVEEKFNRLDKTCFKMHYIVHHFAESVVEKECLNIGIDSHEELRSIVVTAYSDDLYHLHVKLGKEVEFLDSHSLYKLQRLRSLIVSRKNNGSLSSVALFKIFSELTCLRSLSLSRCHLKYIPSNISDLIHLRWLKLSKNYALKELPETICKLYNLQTLSVSWCDGLIHFPKGVKKLTKLMHLKNDYTYFSLPKGIGKLSGLRKLLRITIDPKLKDAFCLRDLKKLNNISGSLTIFFIERERDTLVEDAKQAQLKEKKHITALSLNFPERAAEEWIHQEDEELIEALKPHQGLELLRITSFTGQKCPSWINTLTYLRKLKLWYWNNCVHLPALGKLPCLEHVEFNNFGRVKKVSAAFYRMDGVMEEASSSTAPLFPKLKSLQFMNMNEWEEWIDHDGDEQVMPCLSYLRVENCPKLKALPNFIHKKATLRKQIS